MSSDDPPECSMQGRRVVLLSRGNFNPPTYAHLRMFERARDYLERTLECNVVEGLMSPYYDHQGKSDLVASKHRLRMVEASLRKSSWIRCGDWECTQPSKVNCLSVLKHYQKDFSAKYGSDIRVMLLCGGDVVDSITKIRQEDSLWELDEIDDLLIRHGLVVLSRPNTHPAHTAYLMDILRKHEKHLHMIEDETYPNDASSTRLRTALRRGESIKYCTSEEVIEYIMEHGLYSLNEYQEPGCSFHTTIPTSSQSTVSTVHIDSRTSSSINTVISVPMSPSPPSQIFNAQSPQSQMKSPQRIIIKQTPVTPSNVEVILEPMKPPISQNDEHVPECPLSRRRDSPKEEKIVGSSIIISTPTYIHDQNTFSGQAPAPPIRSTSARPEKIVQVKEEMMSRSAFEKASPAPVWQPCKPPHPPPSSTRESSTTRDRHLRNDVFHSESRLPPPLPKDAFMKPILSQVSSEAINAVPLPPPALHWSNPIESPNYDNVTLDELLEASTSWAAYMSQQCRQLKGISESKISHEAIPPKYEDLQSTKQKTKTSRDKAVDDGARGEKPPRDTQRHHEKSKGSWERKNDKYMPKEEKKKTWLFSRTKSLKERSPSSTSSSDTDRARGLSTDPPISRSEMIVHQHTNGHASGGGSAPMPNVAKTSKTMTNTPEKKTIRFANSLAKSAEDLAVMSNAEYPNGALRRDDPMSKSCHDGELSDEENDGKITLSFRRYRLTATPETTV